MDLTHEFTVPTSLEQTWAHFGDIAAVGQCFPGATVTEADDESFKGTVKVKLGPIALVYSGTGTFVDKDEAAHRFVVDAKGKDKRGNGTAGAKVTLSMAEGAAGGTDVTVVTDLTVTGKPAQFGRGVMQDVSDKLLGQFVACLEQRLGEESASPAEATEPPSSAESASAMSSASSASSEPVTPAVPQATSAPEAADPAAAASPSSPEPRAVPRPAPATAAPSDDAIDLGATVLPVLIKSYWKQGAIGLVVVLVILWLIFR